jgi:hypothetical protein
MAIIISWSNEPRTKVVRKGYLFCRKCLRRTSGELRLVEQVSYLFGFLPLGVTGASANYLTCQTCDSTFNEEEGDWAFDFGDHAEPKKWDCRRCGEVNTSERFTCRKCGKRI